MMKSEEERSEQPTDHSPPLCANGCGFYGSVATLNLCSKCHKQHVTREGLQKSLPKSNNNPNSPKQLVSVSSDVDSSLPPTSSSSSSSSSSNSIMDVIKADDDSANNNMNNKNRCFTCNKKVGLSGGFKCRCGSSFCSKHRYPETHDCTFNFKALGRDTVTKANPVVKGDKVVRF